MKKEVRIHNDCRNLFSQEIIETILESRGVSDYDRLINPPASDILPFDLMKNVDIAGEIIANGIKNNKIFYIEADVDQDGIGAFSIMMRYLRKLGIEPYWWINEKKVHGTTYNMIDDILEKDADIIIIVDSLDSNIDNYKILHDAGKDVIVIDHHSVDSNIPYDDYVTLVTSNRDYPNKYLSGSGCVWKLCMYLDQFIFGTNEAFDLVDLGMTGIVSDLMPLAPDNTENRAIVNLGINHVVNPALTILAKGYQMSTSTIAFSVAPRINACNRINRNKIAALTFLEDDEKDLKKYAKELDKAKEDQNAEVDNLINDAMEQAKYQIENGYKMLIIVIDSVYGINGLLATRLVSYFKLPVLVLSEKRYGYEGSMRSNGIDLYTIINESSLAECYGHSEAAGISIAYNNFDQFISYMNDKLSNIEFINDIEVDAQIDVWDINSTLIDEVKKIDKITGMNFPQLQFIVEIDDFSVEMLSKGKHLGIKTQDVLFIKWNFNDSDMYEKLEDASLLGDKIKLIGSLDSSFVYGIKNKMILNEIILA